MTVINIGTNKGNIRREEIDKPWNEITYEDVKKAAENHFGEVHNLHIFGWANVTKKTETGTK